VAKATTQLHEVKKDAQALAPAYMACYHHHHHHAYCLYKDLRSKADVDLSSSHLTYESAIVVSVGLQLNPTLLRLNLQYNQIRDSGAVAIAEGLKVNWSLQKLVLRSNTIDAAGAAAIAEALKVNSILQQLNLYRNLIGDSGAAAIAEALQVNSSLQQLDLQENHIGDSGAAAIEDSLELSFLGFAQKVNASFPEVLLESSLLTEKYRFLCALREGGYRSFILNDVPPALWPHALAKVNVCPSLIFHLVLQIPVKDPPESVSK
jgi:Leucine-rich repeat (LRR) protein